MIHRAAVTELYPISSIGESFPAFGSFILLDELNNFLKAAHELT